MDCIIIKNLEIYAYHGVYAEENVLGQKFILSLELFTSLRSAGKTDNLNHSINYGDVCHFIEEEFKNTKHQLIEACAEALATSLLLKYPTIEKVHLLLKKPWAPIGSHLDYAGVEITRQRHRAFIGIGSNLGEKEENIKKAISHIGTDTTQLKKISSFYQTKPWGNENQEDFVNCVVEIATLDTPMELLTHLQGIEQKLKRVYVEHWGPRIIDLDILLYDDIITDDPELVIPHPYMEQRLFVLTPLAEIAPWVIHPLSKRRIYDLNEALSQKEEL